MTEQIKQEAEKRYPLEKIATEFTSGLNERARQRQKDFSDGADFALNACKEEAVRFGNWLVEKAETWGEVWLYRGSFKTAEELYTIFKNTIN